MTFHTLERVKADTFEAESDDRAFQEAAIVACADAVLASCDVEAAQFVRLYNADASRVHVVPLGVEHAFFAPGYRPQARRALGLDGEAKLLLFVGRLQALEGSRPRARDVDRTAPARSQRACSRSSADLRAPTDARRSSDCTSGSIEAGVIDHVMLRRAPTSPAALDVDARGRRHARALACRELRSRRPRVLGLRHARRRERRRWTHDLDRRGRDRILWSESATRASGPTWSSARSTRERATAMSNAAVLRARQYTWRAAGESLAALIDQLAAESLVRC